VAAASSEASETSPTAGLAARARRAAEVLGHLRAHRTIRQYAAAPVDEAHVLQAVEAGQAASTSSAQQAYSVLRVRDPAQRRRLAELSGAQAKVAEAGAFFVIGGDLRRHRLLARRAGRPLDGRLEAFLVPVIDATLFAQNLALAFEALGYGVCFIGGVRNRLPEVDALLGVPEGVFPLYGLCVGAPAEAPTPRPRLPLEAVLFDGAYPDDDALLAAVDGYDEGYQAYLATRAGAPAKGGTGCWIEAALAYFETPRRPGLAAYYAAKGADLR
jgi:nitroreductase